LSTPPSSAGSSSDSKKVARTTPPVIPDHTLLQLIGRGSYGEVWRGRNVMGTDRAVKIVYRSTFDHDDPYEREFNGIRKFEPISRSHESQVNILHIGRNDAEKYFYYVMELADAAHPDGDYLPRTLQYEIETRERLPFDECLRITIALSNALNHLHKNELVHRDIKPSNIIFVNGIPKLADIGLVSDSEATITYVGAQGFMPPEGPGRPQGDIYSLGKVIYEICSGRDRLDFPALPENFGDWPDRENVLELLAISNKACEPDADKRYASAEELIADLVMLQAGKSVRRLRLLERSWKWAAVLVGLALLVAAGAWIAQAESRSRERARQREVWIREAQMLRQGDRQISWSSNALQRLAEAAQVRLNDDLRTQAAATLNGLDAHAIKSFQNTSATFLTFDPQGRRLLMDGGEGGHVKIWDSQTDQIKIFSTTNSGPVWFDHDRSPLQFVSNGAGVFLIQNLENGETLREFHASGFGRDSETSALTVSEDGKLCGVAVLNRTNHAVGLVAIWEITNGKLVAELTEGCTALAFAADDSCFASGDEDGKVRVRALPDLKEVASFRQGHAAINCLALQRNPNQPNDPASKDLWLLSAGDAGGAINIFQVAERKLKAICRGSQYDIYSTAFSPDGMTLASSGRGEVKLWDVATGRNLLTLPGYDFAVALAFSPDGGQLAIGTVGGFGQAHVGVIELEPGRGVSELRGLSSQVSKVEFSHDGRRLAALAHNWQVGIWNLESNRLERLLDVPKGLVADNAALAFSRDGGQLAFTTLTDTCLWEIKSGRLLRSWRLPRGLVQLLCFDPVGRLLHFQWDRPWEKEARMCRVRDLFGTNFEKPLCEFPALRGTIFNALLSRGGDVLAIVSNEANGDHIVKIFDPISGRELCAFPNTGNHGRGSDWIMADPQFSRVGYWLGEKEGTSFFTMPRGEPWRNVLVREVRALSPDGRLLLAQAEGAMGINLFKADNLEWRLTLGIDQNTTSVQSGFSPDGKLFAWGTAEGTVLICDLQKCLNNMRLKGLAW
jgi:serine/threonine protein kinase/WD40 repeat protein